MAGLFDLHFVQATTLMECGGLIGLLCCCVNFSAVRGSSRLWGAMICTVFVGAIYGWGLFGTLDSVRDKSAPAYFSTLVMNKYETHGKSTNYHLTLAPWGPMEGPDNLDVGYETYNRSWIGSEVCLELHSGVIHVQWYRVVACDRRTLE